ncbi:MAG: FAD-dependent oxidoreductase [Niabella sp.]
MRARKPSRNWMVDGEGYLRPVLKKSQALIKWNKTFLDDFTVEASFKKTEDNEVFFGVALNIKDSANFVAVKIVADDRLQIVKVKDMQEKVLTEIVLIERYKYPEIWKMTVDVKGNIVSATVVNARGNVMAQVAAKDAELAKRNVGLYCTDFSAVHSIHLKAGSHSPATEQRITFADERTATHDILYHGYTLIKPSARPETLNTPFEALGSHYDIIVAGGGTGGWAAAVQAARMGSDVLLIEETDWLGGQMSAAAVTSMDESGPQVRERGIYREFHESMLLHYYTLDKDPFQAYYHGSLTQNQQEGGYAPVVAKAMLYGFIEEARNRKGAGNLHVIVRSKVSDVIRKGQQVTGVKITFWEDEQKTQTRQLSCKMLVDATEYGDVIPFTKAPYRIGNSSSSRLDINGKVQDYTFTGVIREYPDGIPGHLRLTEKPPNYEKYKKTYNNKKSYGNWGLSTGERMYRVALAWRGMADTSSVLVGQMTSMRHTLAGLNGGNDYPVTVATIESEAKRLQDEREGIYRTLSIVYYLQNELGVNWALAEDQGYNTKYNQMMMKKRGITGEIYKHAKHLPQLPYVRESRRIIGVKTLVAEDLERGARAKHFNTSVAMGDYFMDLHGTYEALEFDLDKTNFSMAGGPFQVPFEVFIPQSLNGFLPAEKNFSQSRLVSGATRLQPVTMLTGQAVGVIASLAVAQKTQPRFLNPLEIQLNLLDEGATLTPRWYTDVPWKSELWKSVQILNLYKIMDRPGPFTYINGMEFTSPEKWGAGRGISENEALEGLKKLAALLGYSIGKAANTEKTGASITWENFTKLATIVNTKLGALAVARHNNKDKNVVQEDFALFSLELVRLAFAQNSKK